jgi:hypothetical protein
MLAAFRRLVEPAGRAPIRGGDREDRMELHITNGDIAAGRIHEALGGLDLLPWRDILHEGPVPAGLAPVELAAVRAAFIAGTGWGGSFADVLSGFRARDAALDRLGKDELALWFEHDLYDQLQLVQVLVRVHARPGRPRRLRLFQSHRHLGSSTSEELRQLANGGVLLGEPAFQAADLAWRAFTSATPEKLAALRKEELEALPCLWPAIRRLLEELPRPRIGLSTTEALALEALAEGPATPSALFAAVQEREAASFMGDLPFFARIEELGLGRHPLIAGVPQSGFVPRRIEAGGPLSLTEDGAAVLAGRLDRLALAPLRRWLGGTWIGPGSVWRWDPSGSALSRDP